MVKRRRTAQVIAVVAILGLVYAYVNVRSTVGRIVTPGTMSMTGNTKHMPMLEATAPDSFTPKADALPSSGWTATASDQSSSNPASYAIDGNRATFWHSNYTPPATPLPHSITIDMRATNYVSGVTYLPRQDQLSNGNIGQYSISISSDGTNWGTPVVTGTWADDKTLKTAVFSGVSGRYVRLIALTEAGNRGPFSSAAEIGLLGNPAIGPALPRTGWTVSADSQASTTDAASSVLDGNGTTIWHTPYTGTIPPLPHSITTDMHSTQLVSGLSYLPRQDALLNGTIGQYSISVSSDGSNWGSPVAWGTWADDHRQKYAVFTPVSAQFVRLTALTESGNRGPWTSAAEINIHGEAPAAGVGGSWSAPIGFPIVPVSAVMLPNNKLLTFSAFDDMAFDFVPDTITKVAILDLNTGRVTEPANVNTHHQMFCTGLALLADGRVLINGGSNDRATTVYDPRTNTWTAGSLMNIPRAYEGDTLLSTGQVLTLGGSWYDAAGNKNGELFTRGVGWRKLSGVLAKNILTADPGGVFRAGNHV